MEVNPVSRPQVLIEKGATKEETEQTSKVDSLIKKFYFSPNFSDRCQAAEALGKMGDPRAIPALVRGLYEGGLYEGGSYNDYYIQLNKTSAVALINLNWNPKNFETKIYVLAKGENIEGLKKIGQPAVTVLIKFLKDKNYEISLLAAATLGKMGTTAKEAVPDLIEFYNTEVTGHWQIIERIGRAAPSIAAISALGQIAPDSEEVLALTINTLENHRYISTREKAAESLGKIALALKEKTPKILQVLKNRQNKDNSIYVEIAILNSLCLLGEKEFEPLLANRKKLLDSDSYLGSLIVSQSPARKTDEYIDLLVEIARPKDKYACSILIHRLPQLLYWQSPGTPAVLMAEIEDERVIPFLVSSYNMKSTNYQWGLNLKEGLDSALNKKGYKTKEETLPVLLKGLKSSDAEVVSYSILALDVIGYKSQDIIPELLKALENKNLEDDAIKKAMTLMVAADSSDPRVRSYLIKTLDNPNLRWLALSLLEKIGPAVKEAVPALKKSLNYKIFENQDYAFRYGVFHDTVKTISNIDPEEATQLLIRVALDKKMPLDVREEAVKSLGEKGPSVAKQAVPALTRFFTDKEMFEDTPRPENAAISLQNAALFALKKMGPEAIDGIILGIESDNEPIQKNALYILPDMGPRAKEALPKLREIVATKKSPVSEKLPKTAELERFIEKNLRFDKFRYDDKLKTLVVKSSMTEKEKQELKFCFIKQEDLAAVERLYHRSKYYNLQFRAEEDIRIIEKK